MGVYVALKPGCIYEIHCRSFFYPVFSPLIPVYNPLNGTLYFCLSVDHVCIGVQDVTPELGEWCNGPFMDFRYRRYLLTHSQPNYDLSFECFCSNT